MQTIQTAARASIIPARKVKMISASLIVSRSPVYRSNRVNDDLFDFPRQSMLSLSLDIQLV